MLVRLNKKSVYIYIILSVILLVFSFNVYEDDALDLGRYYGDALANVHLYNNITTYIYTLISSDVDFIYQTSLFMAAREGVNLSFVTVFFLSLYYISIYKLLDLLYGRGKFPQVFLIFIFLLCPLIWTLTISRTIAALSFLYIACYYIKREYYIKSIFFFCISVFTHVSILIFAAIICGAFLLSRLKFKIRVLTAMMIGTFAYFLPNLIMDAISPYVALLQSRYSYYATMEMQSPLFASNLGIGDKLPIVFIYLVSLFLLIKDKRSDWTYYVLYISWCLLSFFIWSDVMMTNRMIMFSIPFIGISWYAVVSRCNLKLMQIISYLGILISIGSLYTYRTMFI